MGTRQVLNKAMRFPFRKAALMGLGGGGDGTAVAPAPAAAGVVDGGGNAS